VGDDRNVDPEARVGSRRRQTTWREREAAQQASSDGYTVPPEGYSVPPELALVPVSAYKGQKP
jgi:hypothetical protein